VFLPQSAGRYARCFNQLAVATLASAGFAALGAGYDYSTAGKLGNGYLAGGLIGNFAGSGGSALLRQGGSIAARLAYAGRVLAPELGGAAVGGAIGYGMYGTTSGALYGANLGAMAGGFFSPACFAAGTPILTSEGFKPVEAIQPGDYVVSRDEDNLDGVLEAKVVEEKFVREGLLFNLNVAGQVIATTAEHPFYEKEKGWTAAGELKIGDQLASDNGQWLEVEDLLHTGEADTVYNMRVADYHTYFVGCDEWGWAVWAHNANYERYASEAELDNLIVFNGFTVTQSDGIRFGVRG